MGIGLGLCMINQIKINDKKLINFQKEKFYVKFYLENGDCLTLREVQNQQNIQILCNGLQIWKTRKTFQSIWLYKEYYSNEYYSKTKNPFSGKKHKDCTKERWSKSMKGRYSGHKNPFYGRTHSQETKEKLSKISSQLVGDKNPFFGKTHSDETRKILSEKTSKWLKTKNGQDALTKSVIATLNRPFKKTKIEKIVEKKLIENNLHFTYNKIIGSNQYDFIVHPNVLIECQGDYWHGNPEIYEKEQLNERQQFKQRRDQEKKEFAENLGYVIYYIWERDILNNDFSSIEVLWK